MTQPPEGPRPPERQLPPQWPPPPGRTEPHRFERTPPRAAESSGAFPLIAAIIVGVLVGTAATLLHRHAVAGLPAGLLAAALVVGVGGVFARAAADRLGVFLHALATLVTALALTFLGGGDVLVADDLRGRVLLLGVPIVALLLPMLTPARWYRDEPRRAPEPES